MTGFARSCAKAITFPIHAGFPLTKVALVCTPFTPVRRPAGGPRLHGAPAASVEQDLVRGLDDGAHGRSGTLVGPSPHSEEPRA